MFLTKIKERNPRLLQASFDLHQQQVILPDSYIVDLDTLKMNAKKILMEAKRQDIKLYFMLKQLGRNPMIAKTLMEIGYEGAVVVDFKEAKVMMKHQIPIANVGHLVQPPLAILQELIDYNCTYFTVFSIEKIRDIHVCAKKSNKVQNVLLKVVGDKDILYSGQTAGFHIDELDEVLEKIKDYTHVEVKGVTSFPCFLYDEQADTILQTANFETLKKATGILQEHGVDVVHINAPSTTSVQTLQAMQGCGIHSAEPGHGLSGTTPLHAHKNCAEIPCVTYVTEISHNFDQKAYCYGGGFYRRSHLHHAFVGNKDAYTSVKILPPALESIDYYFTLLRPCEVNDTVVMAFRYQIFVTRSHVCIVEGIQTNTPRLLGTYTSLGDEVI